MRTEAESERVHELAVGLLRRRGISERDATYGDVAAAYEVVAEACERGASTLAEVLAYGAIGHDATDEITTRVLARHASDGRFVADLSLDEETLLRSAIAAEQAREVDVLEAAHAETHSGRVEYVHGAAYCADCGFNLRDHGCRCRKT